VGSFIGATIAIKYVTHYPGKISKLVLLSFNPMPITARPNYNEEAFEEEYKEALKSPSYFIKKFWEKTIPDPRYSSLRDWGHKSTQRTPPDIFVNSHFNYKKEDIRPLLKKIDVPTLILYGDKKHPVLKGVNKLKDIIPGSEIVFFEGLDLCFLNMFAANKFNKILDCFVNVGEVKKI
jgi:pimeloyl-ACP methyl ester carboxylesterase